MKLKQSKILCVVLLFLVMGLTFFLPWKVQAATTSTGTVTASSLNVREKATTSSNILGKVKQGTQVTILSQTKDSSETIWYKVTVAIGSKKVTGYVSSTYIEKNKTYTYVVRTGVVNASSLNIREKTSTASKALVTVPKGTKVTVLGETTVNQMKWYKVSLTYNSKIYTGYTYSTYITRNAITTTSTKYSLGIMNSDNVVMYNKANTYTQIKAKLMKNEQVIVLGNITVDGVKWYRIKARINETVLYGYVQASSVTITTATTSSSESLKATITSSTTAYKIAATVSGKVKSLSQGKSVKVLGNVTVAGTKWYYCKFTVSGKTVKGYIVASCVELDADAEFLQSLNDFPSSYHSYLKALHEKYPNWKFVAIDTGIKWSTVIENESKVGRNTIQSNVPKGGSVSTWSVPLSYLSTESGAYNWATDSYTLCDGSNWYSASSKVIAYYMDPRNSLAAEKIWQYEALAYDSNQSISVVQSILNNTFMSGNYSIKDILTNKKVSGNYAQTFMEAAVEAGVSPYFLAIRAKQELGSTGSGSSSGTYSGYEGYYNFYNIGASDSSTGGAIANGLKWASTGSTYLRPWTSPYSSIIGGAQYIASSYISKGQNTLYFQKFNVVYSPLYSHQYMTSVMAPTSEAKSQYTTYSNLGILDENYTFYIPVYDSMPTNACSLPASSGNPNSYLKTLTAKNGVNSYMITPTFNYLTTSYTIVVPTSVTQLTIGATSISSKASVSGTGTYVLKSGETTTVTITCTAENGTKTKYTIKIARL